MRKATAGRPIVKLNKEERAAVKASREARARGERGLSVAEARKLLWQLEDAHKKRR